MRARLPVTAAGRDRHHGGGDHHRHEHAIKHVLLVSVDGLHQSDLDWYVVQAVLNWIDGYTHQRTQEVGVPAIFGMSFQTVSTAEKLPTSDGLAGGDLPETTTPGSLLQRALQYINDQLKTMDQEIQSQGLAEALPVDAHGDRQHRGGRHADTA